jgi:hypothetical protein
MIGPRKVIAILFALAIVPSAAAGPNAPPGALSMSNGEAREIAYRFAQDWADLLDGKAKVGGCANTSYNHAVCNFRVTGPTICDVHRLIVWKSAPHTYYARARGVSCGH